MNKECKMKNQFYLAHVVLYAKRWYNWTEDFYGDLSRMLELDGYPGYYKHDRDGIARQLKYAYEKWCEFLDTCPEYHMAHGRDFLENQMFHMYRYSERCPERNFNDFCDIVCMAVLCEFSNAQVEYMNIPCPEYDEENLPNKTGLFGNFSAWYEEANQNGINGNKNIAKFFNEKAKEYWNELNI